MTEVEIHDVEMRLLSIDDLLPAEKQSNLMLIVKEVGSWILKLRHSGVIFNNRELIMTDNMTLDGIITFPSLEVFKQVMIGTSSLTVLVKQTTVEYEGDSDTLNLLANKLHIASVDNTIENSSLPVRAGRLASSDGVQPLKAGWLLKKRDIIGGWKCRYFEVYDGKLVYFADHQLTYDSPRGSISLANAIIHPVKTISIKRTKDYSCIVVETKNPDKLVKLASERTGLDGIVEANGWFTVLKIAAGQSDLNASKTLSINSSNKISKPNTVSLALPKANMPLARDNEDKQEFKQTLLYASLLCIIVGIVIHNAYMSSLISFKFYFTSVAIITLALSVVVQEYLSPNDETDEADSTESNTRPISRVLSRMYMKGKNYLSTQIAVQSSSAKVKTIKDKNDPSNTSMYVNHEHTMYTTSESEDGLGLGLGDEEDDEDDILNDADHF